MLGKKNRLAKTKDVKETFARGRGFFSPFFTLRFLSRSGGVARFTFVVSTKVSKNATARNRLKRILRELVRLRLSMFSSGNYAVILKPLAVTRQEKELKEKFLELCRKQGLFKPD